MAKPVFVRTVLTAVLFGILGLIGNWFRLPLFLNIDFLFGSFFVMLAVLRLGTGAGVLASVIASSCTILLWKHPWAMVIFTAEAAFVGWQARRRGTANILVYDIVYWLVLGTPLVWGFYHFALGDTVSASALIMLKQSLNGTFNTLLASLVHLAWQTRSADRSALPSFRQLAFTTMVSLILFPALLHVVVDLRGMMRRESEQLAATTSHISEQARNSVLLWLKEHHRTVRTLAGQVGDPDVTPRAEMQRLVATVKEATPAFSRMGVLDATATSIAYDPLVDDLGHPTLGRSFRDRPHARLMRESMTPHVGDVIMGRVGRPSPMVPLLAPLIVAGKYKGYCIGVVNLDEMKGLLKGFVGGRPVTVTLVDSLGQVIVSSRGDRPAMSRLARPDGWTGQQVSGDIRHWVPPTEKGKNIMSRWRGSQYVRELPLGPDAPWKVVVESSFRPVLDDLTATTAVSLAQLAALILIIVPLSHLASRRLVAALRQLQAATESFPHSLADHTVLPLPTSAIREVDGLVRNFRLMASSLADHVTDLRNLNDSLEQRVTLRTRELDEALMVSVREREKIEALIAAITDCVTIIDRSFSILYQNRTGDEKFGTCAGRRCYEAYAGNLTACADCSVREVFQDGQVHRSRRSRMVNGSVRHLDVCASPLRDETGAIVAAVEVLRDVTDEVLAQETLREKERHLQTIIDTSPECIKLVAHDGTLLMMNRAGLAMVEADSPERVQGQCVYDMVTEPCRHGLETLVERVFSGETGVLEFESTAPRSGRRWFETHAAPFRNDRDEIVAMLAFTRDITARKRYEQELQEARKAAEVANQAKSRFLANMSHELRTPMTGTLGMLELVLAEELPPRQRANLEMGYTSATSLLRLLNDILDFARIEAGKVSFEQTPFHLGWCVKSAMDIFTLEAGRKGLTLSLEVEPGTPGMVTGDEGRVRQVLVNLIGNAVKFTEQGSVTVRLASGVADAQGRREVIMTVSDTGIGIPRDKQAAIFKPFVQADASHARSHGGAGLGLAISSEVVQQMGGTLCYAGEPGAGSVFTATIPFTSAGTTVIDSSGKEEQPPAPLPAGSCRILIVEDDPTNRYLLENVVRGRGYRCDVAGNGREAVEMWQNGEYGLIIMDVQMPQMDGIEATRLIREQEHAAGGHIPIVAVTAHAFTLDREQCLASGMDAYLAKPVDVEALCRTLADLTRPPAEQA